MTKMKAVYISEFGGPEVLRIEEVEHPPRPKEGQVLVKVEAAALNRADLIQRKGLYPAPAGYPERIPGLEFAGSVAETGAGVTAFDIGERVFGIIAGGGQAEYVLASADQLARIPKELSFEEAATIPEAFITAYDAVWTQGSLKPGETLMIHAVGSGVGLAALQIAKAAGNSVIGTSRTVEKLVRCEKLGLETTIDTSDSSEFEEPVKDATDGRGVDVILDLVGAKFFSSNLKSLALKGRLILVGLVGGRNAEIDMGLVLRNRLSIIGTVLRSRTEEEKAAATRKFIENVLPEFEKGTIAPNLDRVYPLEDVVAAHEYLESNKSFGKVVLTL